MGQTGLTTTAVVAATQTALVTQQVILPEQQIISWTPSSEVVGIFRAIAGIALIVWLLFIIFKFLFPGRGSRNAFRQMGFWGVAGAAAGILICADISQLPVIANWLYQHILLPVGGFFTGLMPG